MLYCARGANAAAEIPVERQVMVLSRALSYDSELKTRAGTEIVVGVLTKPGNADSAAMGVAVLGGFKLLANVRISGLTLTAKNLSYTNPTALLAAATSEQVDVIYVCVGLDSDLPAIIEVARKRQNLTLGSSLDQVTKGLALGVFVLEGKPTVYVNLTAARSEGAALSTELLRIAKVIK